MSTREIGDQQKTVHEAGPPLLDVARVWNALSQGPLNDFTSELSVSAHLPICTETFGCLLSITLTGWCFESWQSYSFQETPCFWVSLQGGNVPTYIFPEVLACSLLAFPNVVCLPMVQSCPLLPREGRSAMLLSILQSLCTSKQRPKHTPAGLLSGN